MTECIKMHDARRAPVFRDVLFAGVVVVSHGPFLEIANRTFSKVLERFGRVKANPAIKYIE